MIANISEISEVLNELPLRNLNYAASLERFIEIGNRWVLLSNFDLMIAANVAEMAFKHNTSHSACGAVKF